MLLIGSGRDLNLLARGSITVISEDEDSPKENLCDGDPGEGFAFESIPSGFSSILVDGDLGRGDGAFDTAFVDGAPVGWLDESTAGGSMLVRDTSTKQAGASSMRLQRASGGIARGSRIYNCRAGERMTFEFYLRGPGVAEVEAYLLDMETGEYFSDNKWTVTRAPLAAQVTAAFNQINIPVDVSSMSQWPVARRRLKLMFELNDGSNPAHVDEVYAWPSVDTLGVFGHNLINQNVLRWEESTASSFSSSTLLANITPRVKSFYKKLSDLTEHRFQRFTIIGEMYDTPWFGEMVACQTAELEPAMTPVQTTYTDHRIEVPRYLGGVFTRPLANQPRVTKSLAFHHPDTPSTAESGYWSNWYNEFVVRPFGGIPAMIIPTDTRSEVLFGHITPVVSETDGAPGQPGYKRVDAVRIEELPILVEI